MATDWIAALKGQSEIVQLLTRELPKAIAHSDLTIEQASQIYGIVEKGAQDFRRIVEGMNGQGLDDRLYVAAGRLEDIWAALSVAAANKLQAMQEPEPTEFSDRRGE